jgi:hypothetical protein
MRSNRLDSVSPELANAFRDASRSQRSRAALIACRFAVENASLQEKDAVEALDLLKYGETSKPDIRERLEALAGKFDDAYFASIDEPDEWTRAESLKSFSKARAASALAFAFDSDSDELHEVLYEAAATTDNADDLLHALREALGSDLEKE